MTRCKAVAFFNEDLGDIDPVYVVQNLELPVFEEDKAISVMLGNKIIACGGVSTAYKGVGHCWFFVDKNIPDNAKGRMAVIMKKALYGAMEKFGFHRIQADVQVGLEAGHRVAKFAGFEYEGTMRGFGPNKEDFDRYAIVRC